MIVKMKKITLICMNADREATLNELRELGVMHLTHVVDPDDGDLDRERTRLGEVDSVLSTLASADPTEVSSDELDSAANPEAIVTRVLRLTEKRNTLSERGKALVKEIERIGPLGSFNPKDVQQLAKDGIVVKLFHTVSKEPIVPPDGVDLFEISKSKSGTYFTMVSRNDFDFDSDELALPEAPLAELEKEHADIEGQLNSISKELGSLARHIPIVEQLRESAEESAGYCEARAGMGASRNLAYLQGFCPEDAVESVKLAATEHGWGLSVDDLAAEDNPPTLIRYPSWVKPIKAVFDFLEIYPGYKEADISNIFLIFFSVFFAMLIGDAGYGVLFLILTVFARFKIKKAPSYPFVLFGLLSVCTIAWGVMTGNYFGMAPESLPASMQSLMVPWLTAPNVSRNNIIKLCFLLGAIHLTVAHIWNLIVLFPDRKAIAQIGWIGLVWCMFYAARHYVLGHAYPSWILYVFVPAIVLIALFMTAKRDLKQEWIHHAMLPLTVINCFVDIISYIRLFAVGMASAKVAMSVNMITNLGVSKIWTVPIIAAVLIAGHALNIALCGLGILVHGVRLNTLEFSLHRGMEWSGFPYRPFAKKTTEV